MFSSGGECQVFAGFSIPISFQAGDGVLKFVGSPPPRSVSVGGVTLAAHRPHDRPAHLISLPRPSAGSTPPEKCGRRAPALIRASLRGCSVTGSMCRQMSTERARDDDRHARRPPRDARRGDDRGVPRDALAAREFRRVRRNRGRESYRGSGFSGSRPGPTAVSGALRETKSLFTRTTVERKRFGDPRGDVSGIGDENIACTGARRTAGLRQEFDALATVLLSDQRKNSADADASGDDPGASR